MAYRYFYAPCYDGPPLDVTGSPTAGTTKEPGKNTGAGTVFVFDQPHGMVILQYDDPLSRCVVRLVDTSPQLPGWVNKTSGEVLADYPGLPGVV
jgi:hypothetical protein